MPDFGKYAADVAAAYGLSAVLIVGIVALTWRRAREVRRALERAEGRRNG